MKDFYELVNEKNQLPKGRIYQKIIKGNVYFYHQYSIDGVKHIKIVKKDEYESLKQAIDRRIELEKEIKNLLKNTNRRLALSSNAKEMTGYVMVGDKIVATFSHGELISFNEKLCPLIIKRTRRLEPFLKTRVIDSGRTNARILKKILNIKENDDSLVSLASYAASISDNYWFKPLHSKLKYDDISFNNDIFFDVSLKGLITIYPNKISLTPELTTGGSYEKGWKNIDGEWWLYKVGTKEEIFSELLYANLFANLYLPTAHYEYDNGYIKTKNFTLDYNFEPMVAIAGEDEEYIHVFNSLKMINYDIAKQYIRLCFFDAVFNNVDRHNENCGVLRDKKSGKIISLAPNYDDNLSFISRNKNLISARDDGFIKHFIDELKKHPELKQALKETDIPLLTKETIIKSLPNIDIDISREDLIDYILNRYNYLIQCINN